MNQPSSPLEPLLDPHRLRDMVVDKQASNSQQQPQWPTTVSPASIGSGDINSPFQARPASTQQHPNQQSFDFAPPTPVYHAPPPQQIPPNCSPSKPMMGQQPIHHVMNPICQSPQQQSHPPPASPFQRSSSAASNSCPSPYNQPGGQPYTVHQMYPAYGPAATMNVRLPPSYPHAASSMPMPPQQQYANYPGTPTAWPNQNVTQQQHYMAGPPQQPQQRMPYGAGAGYSSGIMPPPSPAQPMMFSRPARPPNPTPSSMLTYPNVTTSVKPPQTPQPQTPGTINQSVGTPPIPPPPQQSYDYLAKGSDLSLNNQQPPLTNQPPPPSTSQNYHFIQQQRLQQFQSPSPIRSPYMPGGPQTGQLTNIQQMVTPGTPTSAHPVRYGQPNGSQPLGQQPSLDMRSPPLVSPVQASQVPPGHHPGMRQPVPHPQIQQHGSMDMSRGMVTTTVNQQAPGVSNGVNLMRMPSVRMAPPFYNAQVFQLMPQRTFPQNDLFLAGCVFFIDETVHLTDLYSRLRYYGGEVETNPSALSHDQHITHIVSTNLASKTRQHLKHPVRSITLNWLTDTFAKRKLDFPTRAIHLPSPWPEGQLPATDKLISSEGFTDSEICCIRSMCKSIGAQYTPYFTQKHAALISKSENGQKSHQANDWKVPVLNYAWLVRLYFGNLQVVNEIGRDVHRPPGDSFSNVDSTPYILERVTELCLKLLNPWRMPIVVNDAVMDRAAAIRQQIESDTSIFAYKKLKQFLPPPTEEQIQEAISILTKNERIPDVRLFIDGMPEELKEQLVRKIRFMGAQLTDSIIECTHYVVPNLKRTLNLCEALARGKDVVDPSWIEHSFKKLHFIDPFDFYVRDLEHERRFRFNVLNTVYRARERSVFEDITFHLSSSVRPSFDAIRNLIEAAGGAVETEKPSLKKIAEHIRYDKTYLIIVDEADEIEYSYLYEKKIPVFNEEFVLMSILRHRIDISNTYRLNPTVQSAVADTTKPVSSTVTKFVRQQPKVEQKVSA